MLKIKGGSIEPKLYDLVHSMLDQLGGSSFVMFDILHPITSQFNSDTCALVKNMIAHFFLVCSVK